MKKHIAVLPGDGVGPEVIAEAIKVLKKIELKYSHVFTFTEALIGAVAIDKTGNPFPKETEELCKTSDAILFGAIGDLRFDNDPSAKVRPEQGLLAMRKVLGLYANVRPIFTFNNLSFKSPLKEEIIKDVDFIVIRELTGGIYFGEPRGRSDGGTRAFDTLVYTKEEILRVSKFAFDLAMKRKKQLTMVDKANVLETSRLWRETVQKLAKKYPEVTVEYMFVDNASMQIIKRPSAFDVILTENMFGDILTDEASVITGSLGMLPSASIGLKTALYEPIHGSYPKAAGLNIANPVGAILSAAMMLDYSFGYKKEADAICDAVSTVLSQGYGTTDITEKNPMSTSNFGNEVAKLIR
jgi:3-isopropylmalate dehydrogenase